jgi:hypothetical protein
MAKKLLLYQLQKVNIKKILHLRKTAILTAENRRDK